MPDPGWCRNAVRLYFLFAGVLALVAKVMLLSTDYLALLVATAAFVGAALHAFCPAEFTPQAVAP